MIPGLEKKAAEFFEHRVMKDQSDITQSNISDKNVLLRGLKKDNGMSNPYAEYDLASVTQSKMFNSFYSRKSDVSAKDNIS